MEKVTVGAVFSTRRRRIAFLGSVLLLSAGALFAAAWLASPDATRLRNHVALRLGPRNDPISLDSTAPIMREAVIATEDERFYRHDGIDLIGIVRALPYDVVHFSLAQGASTITEQVAKVLYLDGSDRDPWRKLEDAALALKLEGRYTKEQILVAYLNSAYFGDGAYGVQSASERYFGVAPRALDTAQATLLAGLIRAPAVYDPKIHPRAARRRQIEVLRSLVRDGYLTQAEATTTIARPLRLRTGRTIAPVRGVDFAPGPAFVWWKLALGVAIAVAGAAAFVGSRTARFHQARGLLAVRVPALVLIVMGVATIVRSFRTA